MRAVLVRKTSWRLCRESRVRAALTMRTTPPLGLGAREAGPCRGHGDQRGQRGLTEMTLLAINSSRQGTDSLRAGNPLRSTRRFYWSVDPDIVAPIRIRKMRTVFRFMELAYW